MTDTDQSPGFMPVPEHRKQDRATILAKETFALQLRALGRTYQQIAEQVEGWGSRQAAYDGVMRALAREHSAAAERVRGIVDEQVRLLIARHLPRALAEDPDFQSAQVVLRAMDLVARVHGLGRQEPVAQGVALEAPSAGELAALIESLQRKARGDVVDTEGRESDGS